MNEQCRHENVIRQPLDCQPECHRRKFIACVACVSELCGDGGPSHHHSRPYVVTHNDSVSGSAGDDLGGGDGNERADCEADGTFAGRPNILTKARCIADASIDLHADDCCDSYAISDGNNASDSVGDIDSCPCAHADERSYRDSYAISNRNADERPDAFIYAVAHGNRNLYFYPDSYADPNCHAIEYPFADLDSHSHIDRHSHSHTCY